MASSPLYPGLNGLARWLAAVLFVFLSAQALTGMEAMYGGDAIGWLAGSTHPSWMEIAGSDLVRGVLLAGAGVLLISVATALWRGATVPWTRWWLSASIVLMGSEWLLTFTPKPGSGWMTVLQVSITMLLFLLAVGMAVWTRPGRREWVAVKEDFRRPGVFAMGVLTTAALFSHVVLSMGAGDAPFGFVPHLTCTIVLAPLLVGLVAMVIYRHPEIPELRGPAMILIVLWPVEMVLGNWCYLISVRQPDEAWMLLHQQIAAGELHLLCGALLAAVSLLLTLQARRHLTARVITSPLRGGAVEA